jgi:hypothetical protein
MRFRISTVVALLCGFVLAVAAPAWAQNPAQNAYAPSSVNELSEVQASSTSEASTLPFTGIDVLGIAAVGVVLLGAGVVVRHQTRSRLD